MMKISNYVRYNLKFILKVLFQESLFLERGYVKTFLYILTFKGVIIYQWEYVKQK